MNNMQQYLLNVSAQDTGKRLDLFIIDFSRDNKLGFSRTLIQGLIQEGRVTVNNLSLIKPHYKVKENDEIRLSIEEKKNAELMPEKIPLEIVYEDGDLAVVNKQPGLVVHPAPGNY